MFRSVARLSAAAAAGTLPPLQPPSFNDHLPYVAPNPANKVRTLAHYCETAQNLAMVCKQTQVTSTDDVAKLYSCCQGMSDLVGHTVPHSMRVEVARKLLNGGYIREASVVLGPVIADGGYLLADRRLLSDELVDVLADIADLARREAEAIVLDRHSCFAATAADDKAMPGSSKQLLPTQHMWLGKEGTALTKDVLLPMATHLLSVVESVLGTRQKQQQQQPSTDPSSSSSMHDSAAEEPTSTTTRSSEKSPVDSEAMMDIVAPLITVLHSLGHCGCVDDLATLRATIHRVLNSIESASSEVTDSIAEIATAADSSLLTALWLREDRELFTKTVETAAANSTATDESAVGESEGHSILLPQQHSGVMSVKELQSATNEVLVLYHQCCFFFRVDPAVALNDEFVEASTDAVALQRLVTSEDSIRDGFTVEFMASILAYRGNTAQLVTLCNTYKAAMDAVSTAVPLAEDPVTGDTSSALSVDRLVAYLPLSHRTEMLHAFDEALSSLPPANEAERFDATAIVTKLRSTLLETVRRAVALVIKHHGGMAATAAGTSSSSPPGPLCILHVFRMLISSFAAVQSLDGLGDGETGMFGITEADFNEAIDDLVRMPSPGQMTDLLARGRPRQDIADEYTKLVELMEQGHQVGASGGTPVIAPKHTEMNDHVLAFYFFALRDMKRSAAFVQAIADSATGDQEKGTVKRSMKLSTALYTAMLRTARDAGKAELAVVLRSCRASVLHKP